MPIYSFYRLGSQDPRTITARQELNSAGNDVAAALQSLTRRKPNMGLAQTDIKFLNLIVWKLQRNKSLHAFYATRLDL